MKTPDYIVTIARAGFEASGDRRGRAWTDLDANEREFWHLAAQHHTAKRIYQARMTGYDIPNWEDMTTNARAHWHHIANAMRAARFALDPSIFTIAA